MKHAQPAESFAAEDLLARMKAAGIDVLLANGGTDFPSIIEAFARASESGADLPEPLVVPHENVAVGMAHGYYLMSGKPAAVMVHVNVGLANSVMGLINAASDSIPILMCSGRTPLTETSRFGSRSVPIHWGQEMRDQASMVRESVKWDYELRFPEQAGIVVDRAMNTALSEPCGPVYLSLPREALADSAPANARRMQATISPTRHGAPAREALDEAAALLATAQNPVIVTQSPDLGEDFEPLAGFVERHALPVVEFWAQRQALPTSHPMHAGRDSHALVGQADVIVTINAMVPWVADHVDLRPGCKVIAIGPDPQFSKVPVRSFPVDISLAGGTVATIAALAEAMERQPRDEALISARRGRIATSRSELAEATQKRVELGSGTPMSPAWVSHCLSEAIDDRCAIFNELGVDPTAMSFTGQKTLFGSPLSGGLGWGVPAALGAQLADRSRLAIACVGDGSYMFANPVACHQTAALLDLPILTVVFNNGIWNAVRRATLSMYPDGRAAAANAMPITGLGASPDYAGIARAHGAHGERVDNGRDLPAAIERALATTRGGQQALLEVMVSY